MIAKDTTTTVNFFVTDTDGLPATGQASNITATISINGGTATTVSDTITEKGSGWYKFNHLFGTVGNTFIEFSCTGCIIMPWEDDVVEMASGSAPSAADIADAVWDEIVFGRTPLVTDSAADILITAAATGTPSSIWNYANRSLTSEVLTRDENYQPIKTLAISSEITTAKDAILTRGNSAWITATGFSTFNPATDTVTINSPQAATMVTATGFATPANITAAQTAIINAMPSTTGLATSSDISTAQTAIINAMPSTTGLATGSDVSTAQAAIIAAMPDISGLSTFDPTNDDVSVSSASITSIQSGLAKTTDLSGLSTFDAANDTVTVESTQAATFVTATGFATPTNVTDAVSALETYGDAHWTGGGGSGGSGITAEDVWKYSGTYGRTLTSSPTDITSLATKTDLTNTQTAIVNAMPSTTGLATATDVSSAQTAIINAIPAVPDDYAKPGDTMDVSADSISSIKSGLATATDVTTAQAAVIAEIPDISGLSTFNPANETVSIDPVQAATMVTASGFATPTDITSAKADIIAAIPSDYAKASDLTAVQNLLTQLDAGVLHWSTTANRLVLYKEDNTVLKVYSLERDADGNITRISPTNA